jgi:predicted ATPase with chaperone activity
MHVRAKVTGCAIIGLEGANIIGLPDAAINGSRERVRSAIRNCGLTPEEVVSWRSFRIPKGH